MLLRGVAAAQSALSAESRRLQASAHNRANTLTEGFQALRVTNVEAAVPGAGVETQVGVVEPLGPPIVDPSGDVIGHASNVSFVDEALTRLTAQRAYEANLVSLQAQVDTADDLLDVVG